jgi:hypothetical protein
MLFNPPNVPALDSNANPDEGAEWRFTLTGTTTPATVYADADLATPLGSEVEAGGGGRFPAIHLDPDIIYRARLFDANGSAVSGYDFDPIASDTLFSQSAVDDPVLRTLQAKARERLSIEDVELSADTNAARRTQLQAAVDAATNRSLAATGTREVSSGDQFFDTGNSDPDGWAAVITDSNLVIDGEGGGSIIVDTADKGVFHIVNGGAEANRPTNVTIRGLTLGQPYSTIIGAGLTDDYFVVRFDGCAGCVAENLIFAPCELVGTFHYSPSSYTDRASKDNFSHNWYAPSVAFMGLQLFGEQSGVHTGHRFHGIDADGESRAQAHGIRFTGFDFAPVQDNRVTDHVIARFTNGLSLQTNVARNTISATITDCQNAAHLPKQATRAVVQTQNRIEVTTNIGDYGIYDEGGKNNSFVLNAMQPVIYGIEASNPGAKTFDGASAVTTGTEQIAITAHGFLDGDGVIIIAGTGTLPTGTGISDGAELFIIKVDANTIKLATTQANALAGTAIDITVAGSGTITLFPTDYGAGNSYSGRIDRPAGARGANLNSRSRTMVDLDIIGKDTSSTSFGMIASGPYCCGQVRVRNCNVGALISGSFAMLSVRASGCTTGLSISGHKGLFFVDIDGNLSVTGNNNTIIGRATGTVTNSGTGNRVMVAAQSAIATLTATATSGSLPTANGSVTIADATTPTVAELLEYCTELKANQDAILTALRKAIIAT